MFEPRLTPGSCILTGCEIDRPALRPPDDSKRILEMDRPWHAAHRCPGMIRLVLDGWVLARVPDSVIGELKGRERNDQIDLPKRPDFVLVTRCACAAVHLPASSPCSSA